MTRLVAWFRCPPTTNLLCSPRHCPGNALLGSFLHCRNCVGLLLLPPEAVSTKMPNLVAFVAGDSHCRTSGLQAGVYHDHTECIGVPLTCVCAPPPPPPPSRQLRSVSWWTFEFWWLQLLISLNPCKCSCSFIFSCAPRLQPFAWSGSWPSLGLDLGLLR